jgi:ABC-2 type transport system ATP-binding protein
LPGVQLIRQEANRVWLRVERADGLSAGRRVAEIMPELFRRYRVHDLSVQEPEIEEVVRRIYEGNLLSGESAVDLPGGDG